MAADDYLLGLLRWRRLLGIFVLLRRSVGNLALLVLFGCGPSGFLGGRGELARFELDDLLHPSCDQGHLILSCLGGNRIDIAIGKGGSIFPYEASQSIASTFASRGTTICGFAVVGGVR